MQRSWSQQLGYFVSKCTFSLYKFALKAVLEAQFLNQKEMSQISGDVLG